MAILREGGFQFGLLSTGIGGGSELLIAGEVLEFGVGLHWSTYYYTRSTDVYEGVESIRVYNQIDFREYENFSYTTGPTGSDGNLVLVL